MAEKKSPIKKAAAAVKKAMPGGSKKAGRQNADVDKTKAPATNKPSTARTTEPGAAPGTSKVPSKTAQAAKTSRALDGATPGSKGASPEKVEKVTRASKAAQSPGASKAQKENKGASAKKAPAKAAASKAAGKSSAAPSKGASKSSTPTGKASKVASKRVGKK